MDDVRLPAEAEELLHLLDDYAVGGSYVTPGTPSYANLKTNRVALSTREDWISMEAVHLNAAGRSRANAYADLGKRYDPSAPQMDRVLLMDFDIYTKVGTLKVEEALTPEIVLERLKAAGVTMPYCYSLSGTPGNFHMLWVLETPSVRQSTMTQLKGIYSYWGADTAFTNSTMRNPLYALAETHFWPEWVDEVPLLPSIADMVPTGFLPALPEKAPVRKKAPRRASSPSNETLFRVRLSDSALEDRMSKAVEGNGRWYLLRSWIARKIMDVYRRLGKVFTNIEIETLVHEGNEMFQEPMDERRTNILIKYWTVDQQWYYVMRQRKAGLANYKADQMHREAVIKYFTAIDTRDVLTKYHRGEEVEISRELMDRINNYSGDRISPKSKQIRRSYLAYVLNLQPKDVIDKDTGEVLRVVSPERQLEKILVKGRQKEYSREEYYSYLDEELVEVDTPGGLTDLYDFCIMVSNNQTKIVHKFETAGDRQRVESMDKPPPREVLYAC